MSKNLERLLTLLRQKADLIDCSVATNSSFRYKCSEQLILDIDQPFVKRVIPTPFRGKIKFCFKNCFQALWNYPELNYCEGFAIDDQLPLAVSHAWLVNNALEVIDPTWNESKSTNCAYFGVVLNQEFVREVATQTKLYGIVDNDYARKHQLLREGFPAHALRS